MGLCYFKQKLICAKPSRIRFDKIDGFIRVYDGTRYLVLLETEKYNFIYNRIRYLTEVKSGITYVWIIMQESTLIHIILPLEKRFTSHNAK